LQNGGMVSHFYERVWRTLFSTVHPPVRSEVLNQF